MIDLQEFYKCLHDAGVDFITGVPDSLLNDFCLYAEANLPQDQHVLAANEGNAVALAAGHHLATGGIPLVYMQNSGIGNAMNPLLSLTNKDVYSIPLVLLIGWRGDPTVKDHAQHKKQGELTPVLLDAIDIPYLILDNDGDAALDIVRKAVVIAGEESSPTAIIVKKGMLAKAEKKQFTLEDSKFSMSREEAIECVLENVPADTLFVATTGRATRELYFLREKRGEGHENDFLNVGAMGHASSIATGLALAAKKRLVVCLDGDAALIMHLGSITTAGKLQLPNLLHVILNNGVHESVGGQASAGFEADLTPIAADAGYKTFGKAVETEQNLEQTVKMSLSAGGPAFIEVRIRKGIRAGLPPLKFSHLEAKELLMNELLG